MRKRSEVLAHKRATLTGRVVDSYANVAEDSDDGSLANDLRDLAPRVHELSQLLVDVLGVTDVGASFPHRVAYHPTCHSLRVLKVHEQPLQLLRSVRGLQLVDLAGATTCCGFGGTFAVKNPDTSVAMLADKLAAVHDSGAEVLCALDNSCLIHIGGGASRLGSGFRTLHLAEILASRAAHPVTGQLEPSTARA